MARQKLFVYANDRSGPDPNNAALVRQNLELNGIAGHVLEAAI